jgi:outer membrane protein OmpA-like peptidoglycan-associated protein
MLRMRRLLFVFAALFGVAAVQAQTPADSVEAVRRAVEDWPNVTVVQDGHTRQVQVPGVRQVHRRIVTLPRRPTLPLRRRTVVVPVFVIVGSPGAPSTPSTQRRPVVVPRSVPPPVVAERPSDVEAREEERGRIADEAEGARERPIDEEAEGRRTPPVVVAPTPEVVERRLLETGLFRTVDVMFEFDKSTLLPPAETTLNAVGEVLTKYPDLRIEVAGHTDSIGSDRYNQRLSERRALAVRQYLLNTFDIAPQRILAVGFGEGRPIASNQTETGRALNRRVEFVVRNPGEMERR